MTCTGTITYAASLFVPCLHAQVRKIVKQDLPAPVLATLQKDYSRAIIKGIRVETKDEGMRYGVVLVEGKSVREMVYRPNGTVVEVDADLPVGKLPVVVRYSVYISAVTEKLKLDLDASGTLLLEAQT